MGEEQLLSSAATLASYGALGVVSIYFMVKDWTISKANTDAIHKFTIALEKLCIKMDCDTDG